MLLHETKIEVKTLGKEGVLSIWILDGADFRANPIKLTRYEAILLLLFNIDSHQGCVDVCGLPFDVLDKVFVGVYLGVPKSG